MEIFEDIIDGLDRRIETQSKLIQKTEDEMQKYGLQKALEAYEETKIFIETIREDYNNGWIPCSERLPENDNYILLSFENFSIPIVGRYEEDENGGAFYAGDELETCVSQDLFVNAWQPSPEPYQKGE